MAKYDLYISDKRSSNGQRKLENWHQKLGLDNFNYTLQEIDKFTSRYDNEDIFRKDLYENNLISYQELLGKGKISIRFNEKRLTKVNLGIVLEHDKYFFDINNLLEYINTSIKEEDFFNKFCNKYDSFSHKITTKGKTIPELRHKTISYLKEQYIYFLDNKDIKQFYNNLNYIINLNLFNIKKENDQIIRTLNYKNFHDMAMFCSNYELKKRKNNQVKIRKKDIDGQIRLF